ncbi:hypothetical protein Afil01_23860 [Actinorhabdospora filicis]|uniref:Uncharacterized protein n=1 Tax=Actinorhabdospora filicis TaxID=1785913 RepID=A0A9W6SI79_9ACTN|nr:hypothetical protein Afil01_23860 [Actinorhabdospora filicis]
MSNRPVPVASVAELILAPGERPHPGVPAVSDATELRLLGADLGTVARFPLPAPLWTQAVVSADARVAAVPTSTAVLGLGPEGELWRFEHADWAEQHGSGSVLVLGERVYAHVPGGLSDRWVVLDARTGQLLAEAPLACEALGSEHFSDGVAVALSVGEGQDACPLYRGDYRDGLLMVREDPERVMVDLRGEAFTIAHYLEDAAVHRPDGSVRLEFPAEWLVTRAGLSGVEWSLDYSGGFVDGETLLVVLLDNDEGAYAHLLLDAFTGDVLGAPGYADPPQGPAYPQGDGTWLTVVDDRVVRWRAC